MITKRDLLIATFAVCLTLTGMTLAGCADVEKSVGKIAGFEIRRYDVI